MRIMPWTIDWQSEMLGDVAEPACNQASSDFRFFHVALCLDIPFQFDSAFSAPILQKRGYIAMTTQIRWQWRQKKKNLSKFTRAESTKCEYTKLHRSLHTAYQKSETTLLIWSKQFERFLITSIDFSWYQDEKSSEKARRSLRPLRTASPIPDNGQAVGASVSGMRSARNLTLRRGLTNPAPIPSQVRRSSAASSGDRRARNREGA